MLFYQSLICHTFVSSCTSSSVVLVSRAFRYTLFRVFLHTQPLDLSYVPCAFAVGPSTCLLHRAFSMRSVLYFSCIYHSCRPVPSRLCSPTAFLVRYFVHCLNRSIHFGSPCVLRAEFLGRFLAFFVHVSFIYQ